jgi:hypothetical protein
MSIAAILAVLVAPILVRWSFMLANRRSEDGVTFRPAPTLRAVYPGGLLLSLWGVAFYLDQAWENWFALRWNDWFGLLGMVALALTAILSWPPTIRVATDGLHWSRLLGRRVMKWDQIAAADTGMDGELVIHGRSGERYEVNQFIQGRPELKSIVEKHLRRTS